jgi:glycosyltransferase involved in cell wall biosynthesis
VVGDAVLDEYRGYEERLRAQVAAARLQDHVVFTGWRDDTLVLASQMAIIVHPSFAEGFGRAVLEAMALGRPVIASAVGGLREAIRDGVNGMLVPPGSVEALADRLLVLLRDPALRERLGREARETVRADYQIHDKVAELSNVWADVMRRS